MKRLAEAVNAAFFKAYPQATDIFGADPEADEEILVKRVNMLIDDLLCTRQNWSASERAYNALDAKHRSIKEYWWQFWRTWKKYQCAPMPERRVRHGFRNPERRKR